MHIYIWVYVYLCIYVYLFIYIYVNLYNVTFPLPSQSQPGGAEAKPFEMFHNAVGLDYVYR